MIPNGRWAAPIVTEAARRPDPRQPCSPSPTFAPHVERRLFQASPNRPGVWGPGSRLYTVWGRKHQKNLCHFLLGDRPRTRQQQRPEAGCGHVAVAAGKWGPQGRGEQNLLPMGTSLYLVQLPGPPCQGRLRMLGQVSRPNSLHSIFRFLSPRRAPPW